MSYIAELEDWAKRGPVHTVQLDKAKLIEYLLRDKATLNLRMAFAYSDHEHDRAAGAYDIAEEWLKLIEKGGFDTVSPEGSPECSRTSI